jgi:hypothetical protein
MVKNWLSRCKRLIQRTTNRQTYANVYANSTLAPDWDITEEIHATFAALKLTNQDRLGRLSQRLHFQAMAALPRLGTLPATSHPHHENEHPRLSIDDDKNHLEKYE